MKRILPLLFIIISFTAKAQLNSVDLLDGTGTVTGSYGSITDAYNAIVTPLTQAYTIELKSTYNGTTEIFPVTLTSKTGASSANTITIRPATGVISMTIISAQTGNAVIRLDDADYVILDGRAGSTGASVLIIENSGTGSNTNTIELINGATNNIIRYCRIENRTTASAGRGIAILNTNTGTGNTDNTIEFCTLASGRYKINSDGGSSGLPNSRLKIYGCELLDIIFVGIWGEANHGTMFVDSNFIHSTNPSGNGPFGILFDSQSDSVYIRGNHIYELDNGTQGSEVTGISIRSTNALRPGYSFIVNNMVALSSVNTSSKPILGIEYGGANPARADVFFNTVYVRGFHSGSTATSVESACFFKDASDDSASFFNIRNNIFVNERTGGPAGSQHPAIAIIDTNKIASIDENTYNSASVLYAVWDTQAFTDLNVYKTFMGPSREQLSNNEPVEFVSTTDVHLGPSSQGDVNLGCTPIAGIDYDFDFQLRGSMPYRGADEDSILLVNISKFETESAEISVFPNPSSGKVYIKVSGVRTSEVDVTIFTIDGKMICSESHSSGETLIEIGNTFSPGCYFLKTNVSEWVMKFVVVD